MAKSERDPGGHNPSSPRIPETSELAARIKKAQEARRSATHGDSDASRQGDMTMLARGLRIAAEFVAAILVGSGIGYLIDQIAGTTPWALLVMFMVGFAAGILNVTRVVAEMNSQKPAPSGDADDAGDRQN